MIFTGFITTFFKSMVSAILAMTVASTSALPGNLGNFAELEGKALTMGTSVTETVVEFDVNVAAFEEITGESLGIPEVPGVYENGKLTGKMAVYSYADVEELKAVISFGEDFATSPAVFVDADGIALNAPAVEIALAMASGFGVGEYYEIYNKYFPGEGFYNAWITGADAYDAEIPEEVMALVGTIVTDLAEIFVKEDNIKAYTDLVTPLYESAEKYITETTVDGVKAYTEKLTIKELLEYMVEVSEKSSSTEMISAMFDYIKELADDVDYVKYIGIYNTFAPEGSGISLGNVTNEQILPVVLSAIDAAKEDYLAYYGEAVSMSYNPYGVIEVLLTGKDETGEYAEVAAMHSVITPIIESSYVESTIYEKDGAIIKNDKGVVSDGTVTYLTLDSTSTTKKYESAIPSASEAVPFDKRVELVEIDNKMGYEAALEKGVHSIDISWNSVMSPEDNKLTIYNPGFYVNYKSSMIEALKNDPAFSALSDEAKELILGMYEDSDAEFKYCASSAELIDNSVYLPLRQIMENAGYEVSWDGEQRKAYVTVAGEKIEMTGVIVNDRTYVKIRDFEKLGATVEYEENFYYENAYNDFDKECYVTITFTK